MDARQATTWETMQGTTEQYGGDMSMGDDVAVTRDNTAYGQRMVEDDTKPVTSTVSLAPLFCTATDWATEVVELSFVCAPQQEERDGTRERTMGSTKVVATVVE